MPGITSKSPLLAKLGSKLVTAHQRLKDKPPELDGGGGLPPGIEDGIAQLTTCRIAPVESGAYKGEPGFYADGVVVEPADHTYKDDNSNERTVRVAGKRTKIYTIVLGDTRDRNGNVIPFDDNYEQFLGYLKKLGLGDYIASLEGKSPDEIDEGLQRGVEMLMKSGPGGKSPFFSFRTWKGKPTEEFPNPRTREVWGERVDYSPPASGPGKGLEMNGRASQASGAAGADRTPVLPEQEPEAAGGTAFNEFEDLDGTVEKADAGDEVAMNRLRDWAVERGYTEEDVAGSESWAQVGEWISAAPGEEAADAEPEPEAPAEWVPEVGANVRYAATSWDPKQKKAVKAKKASDCEVLTVNEENRTVTLKSMVTGKPVQTAEADSKKRKTLHVSWDELEHD